MNLTPNDICQAVQDAIAKTRPLREGDTLSVQYDYNKNIATVTITPVGKK